MLLATDGRGIAGLQRDAVHDDLSTNHVHPRGAVRVEGVRNLRALGQFGHEDFSVLVDSSRAIGTLRSRKPLQFILLLLRIEANLLIARLRSGRRRLDPDLEKMQPVAFGGIELAVPHAGPGRHALNLVRSQSLLMTQAVLMG